MISSTRLFDCLYDVLPDHPKQDLLSAKENGTWRSYSTQEVTDQVNKLSAALLDKELGYRDGTVEGRDKIAIISRNRPEWLMVDLAVQQTGAILVPIYPTINVAELEFILREAQVKLIFINDGNEKDKLDLVTSRLQPMEIFSFERIPEVDHWSSLTESISPERMDRVRLSASRIKKEDAVTIIYTSGTTGTPKGVMLSHDNILSNVLASIPCLPADNLKALSFLPLNHIFERMISYFYLFKNSSIYYAESMEKIGDNLKEVQPNIFTTVPRLLEKVYDRIMEKGGELKGVKRKLFFWAHDLASRYEINQRQSPWYRIQLKLANKIIFSKWREALGNNILCIVSGGAACQVRLIRIFTAAGIPILEGYGLTETSPVISVNRYEEDKRMFGTVGPLLDLVQVKIEPDGEICCKGPNVMLGYYKNAALTQEVITDDGWFHTGDIGELKEGKFLKITDRKKEMFKTSGGKYVAPLPIENKLKESVLIEQVMVVGADKKFVGALIVPAMAQLKDWAKHQQLTYTDEESLIALPETKDLYRQLLDTYNALFSHVEQVKKFELLPNEWTIDSGELTPKLSLKRKVVSEKYAELIDRIYR